MSQQIVINIGPVKDQNGNDVIGMQLQVNNIQDPFDVLLILNKAIEMTAMQIKQAKEPKSNIIVPNGPLPPFKRF